MTSYADPNIEGWYSSHGLPWSGETATKLSELGVECVDDLKCLDRDAVDSLFKDEKPVAKGKVKAAWKKLEDGNKPPLVTAIRDVESQEGHSQVVYQRAYPLRCPFLVSSLVLSVV